MDRLRRASSGGTNEPERATYRQTVKEVKIEELSSPLNLTPGPPPGLILRILRKWWRYHDDSIEDIRDLLYYLCIIIDIFKS